MNPIIHILHTEDNPTDAELVQAKLEEAGLVCRITRVQTYDEFDATLRQEEPDIILADYRLPMCDGMSALRLAQELRPEVPFIFVSSTKGEEVAIEGLAQGATNYVLKHNMVRLESAVKRALQEAQNRRERELSVKELADSEAMTHSILENIGIGVALISPKMEILELNKRMREWFPGIDPTQHPICYKSFNSPPRNEVCSYCPTCKTLKDGQIHEATTQTPQDGKIRNYRIISAPLLNAEGEVVAAIEMVEDITERKQIEEDLRHSNDLLRAMIEAAPAAIIGLDLDGHVHSVWNPTAEKMLGWSAQEVMGRPLPSVPAESQEEFRRFREQVRRGMTLDGVEVRRQRRDGSPIDYSIHTSPLHDAEGHINGNIAVLVDITERKQAEQARLANLKFFENMDKVNRAIQENNDLEQMMSDVLDVVLSVFECDRAWLVYPCDPEATTWQAPMERTRPEYPGALALGLEVPVDLDVVRVYKAVLASNDPVGFGPGNEYPFPTDVAEHFNEQSQLAMAIYPKVDKPYMFGIHQCSWPRVWTQEERRVLKEIGRRLEDALTSLLMYRNLHNSEARYRRIVETTNEGIWMIDKNLIISFVNARMAEMVGYRAEEMIGRPLTDFILKEELSDHYRIMERRRQGLSDHYERRFNHKNGHIVYTLVSAVPILDAQQNFEGAFAMVTDITEHKQAEEALRESYEIINKSPAVVFLWKNTEGWPVEYVSENVKELFGYTAEELMSGKVPFATTVHPDDLERVSKEVSTYSQEKGRRKFTQEYRIITKDGKTRQVDDRTWIRRNKKGEITHYQGIVLDITERKQAEEALREKQDQLIEAQHIAHIGNWWHDLVTGELYWSDEFFRIIGREPQKPTVELAVATIHPDDWHIVQHAMDEAAAGKVAHKHEFRIIRPDGGIRWIHNRWVGIYDEAGKEIKRVGTHQDITERKKAEEALKASEARYIDLYENAPDMYVSVNAQSTLIEECNQTLADILGCPKEGIIGRPVFEIYHPDCRDQAKEVFQEFLERGEIRDKELQLLRKDGSKLDVSLNVSAVRAEDGTILFSRSTLRDITERKRNDSINSARLHLIQFAVTHSLDELLEETLNEGEKLTDSLIGFYHFVEDDQKSLTLQNWSTRTKAEFCKAEGKGLHYPIAEVGVWVDCVYQRKPVIHNDYASLPHRKGMPEGHAEIIRELVVPVFRGNKIKAILGVGNKQTDYTEKDVEVISLLADFAWEIAERERVEEKMLRSDQRLRLHSEQSPLGFLEWDDNFHAIEWNTACERIFGYTREEAIGRHAKDLILPIEVHDLVDGIYHSLMSQTGGQHSINENVTKDGRIIICEWFNTTLINKDGKAIGVASICRDITEQKRMEVELARYREHLEEQIKERTAELEIARNKAQQYLDIAGVILVAIDKNRRVTLINQKGCDVLGNTSREIIGRDWFETFVPENARHDVIQAFNRLMAGEIEAVEYLENPVLTQGGEERLVAWHNVLLKDSEGNIIGTLSSGEDITEQRRAEEQIKSLNQDLLNRTAALEAANKDLEAFAYSVSHDLRAPLRHIDGFIELLQKRTATALDEQSRHYMDTISDSAKRMGKLIDDLLSFSRMGRHQISKQHVDLGELTQEIIREFEPETLNRGIYWFRGDLPVVFGDRAMLRIVLVNLISNALKFTRPVQQAEIEIGCMPDTKTETIIFVRDNGVGFDMNYADKLFSVFQRLHRVDEFEGTGIGLANVRRIIARHGGRTWATGELNQGATFYFSLPQT